MTHQYCIIIHDDDNHFAHLLVKTFMVTFDHTQEYAEFLVSKLHRDKEVTVWYGPKEIVNAKVLKLRDIESSIHGYIGPIQLSIIPI